METSIWSSWKLSECVYFMPAGHRATSKNATRQHAWSLKAAEQEAELPVQQLFYHIKIFTCSFHWKSSFLSAVLVVTLRRFAESRLSFKLWQLWQMITSRFAVIVLLGDLYSKCCVQCLSTCTYQKWLCDLPASGFWLTRVTVRFYCRDKETIKNTLSGL